MNHRISPRSAQMYLGLAVATVLWAAVVVAGFWYLETYKALPGEVGSPAPAPVSGSGGPTLVLFAHPHCPCTRATLDELAVLLARAGADVTAEVLFVLPEGVPEGWERTDLWDRAAALPDVRVRRDDGGAEARRYGARTSGHVLLRSADGRILYSGGITRSRGHAGDSSGSRALGERLRGETAETITFAVFGCSLFGGCDECPLREEG